MLRFRAKLQNVVPLLLFLQPRVELELVVVLHDDVPAQASSETTRLAAAGVFLRVAYHKEDERCH